jgi:nucleoside phosphorylase
MSATRSRPPKAPQRRPDRGTERPWIVLSAFAPELAWLAGYCRSNGNPKGEIVLGTTGIGLVDAAAGASRVLGTLPSTVRPLGVIFIGTAGVASLNRQPEAHQAVVPARLVLHSRSVADGSAYLPGVMVSEVPANRAISRRLQQAGAIPVPLAICPIGITRTRVPRLPRPFVENLEAFAVARAAALLKLPFAAVLGISNTIGPNAHVQWKANAKAASEAACKTVAIALLRAPSR